MLPILTSDVRDNERLAQELQNRNERALCAVFTARKKNTEALMLVLEQRADCRLIIGSPIADEVRLVDEQYRAIAGGLQAFAKGGEDGGQGQLRGLGGVSEVC